MYALLVTIHLFACFIMLCAVMLQSGKGAEMGAAFGGASQTIFGARGPTTFLSKLTVGAAVVFMLTSLSLGIVSRERSIATSAIPVQQPAQPQTAPAPPQDTGPAAKPGLPQVSPAPAPESPRPSQPVGATP